MKKQKRILPFVLVACLLGANVACADPSSDDVEISTPNGGSSQGSGENSAIDTPDDGSEENAPDSSSEVAPPNEENSGSPQPPNSDASSENAPPAASEPPTTPTPETPATPTVSTAQYIKCTGSSVNLRSGAGTNFSVIGNAAKGTMYAVTGKIGSWYKTYYRGQTAYISVSYATVFSLEKTENKVEKVIEEGYKLLGVPYVYGAVRFHDGNGKLLSGFTMQKFDCSSLMQYVFYKGAGVLLGLTTRTQVKQGKYVKSSDLQRGDCIFFTNEQRQYNTGIERIGHVALYLGDGYILHTASDYARIEKMSAKRWSFYIEARRFV